MSFAAIYRRHHQGLYRYCLAILGNPEDAQDALQNTMVKAMRALPGERREIKLKPWLYRIAHNESIDLLRKRRPVVEIDEEASASGPSTAEAAETREQLRTLIADLAALPDRQRGALAMRELTGLSFEQIAAAFDTSPAVARQTVYEARVSLRQMSEGRDMSCDEVCRALSDADGRVLRRRDIRAHLKSCPGCRDFRDGIAARRRDFAALSPLPAIASVALLRGLLGSGGGSAAAGAGGGVAGSVGAGVRAVATSAALKATATVAVVAAVGAGAADRSGLIDVPTPGGGTQPADSRPAPAGSPVDEADAQRGHMPRTAAGRGSTPAEDGGGSRPDASTGSRGGESAPVEAAARSGRDRLPAASAHGQETAAAHRATRGGRSASHPPARGAPRAVPTAPSNSNGKGAPPRSSAPPDVAPDKSPAAPLQPPRPVNKGAPRATPGQ